MKCKKCRKQIPDKAKFCPWCGTPVKEGTLHRRANGYYEKSLFVNGKRKCFYGKSEKEVFDKILAFNEIQDTGLLFSEIEDKWEYECIENVKWNTYKGYKPRAARAVNEFGNIPIKQITSLMVKRYVMKFPRTWAFKTQSAYLSVLNLIFNYALQNDYIDNNVADCVKLPKDLKRTKRKAPSAKEINTIKESINCEGGLLALFFLLTGLRRGEAVALEWSDIDLNKKLITVNKSTHWESNTPVVDTPKTEAGVRQVVIMDELLIKLKSYKKDRKNNIVFPDKDCKMFTNKRFATMWKHYQTETGVTATPHILRHGYATLLKRAGIDKLDAQHLLGHAQYSTTADIYTDFDEQDLSNAEKLLNNYKG